MFSRSLTASCSWSTAVGLAEPGPVHGVGLLPGPAQVLQAGAQDLPVLFGQQHQVVGVGHGRADIDLLFLQLVLGQLQVELGCLQGHDVGAVEHELAGGDVDGGVVLGAELQADELALAGIGIEKAGRDQRRGYFQIVAVRDRGAELRQAAGGRFPDLLCVALATSMRELRVSVLNLHGVFLRLLQGEPQHCAGFLADERHGP